VLLLRAGIVNCGVVVNDDWKENWSAQRKPAPLLLQPPGISPEVRFELEALQWRAKHLSKAESSSE
jgi:hypothetical protein